MIGGIVGGGGGGGTDLGFGLAFGRFWVCGAESAQPRVVLPQVPLHDKGRPGPAENRQRRKKEKQVGERKTTCE